MACSETCWGTWKSVAAQLGDATLARLRQIPGANNRRHRKSVCSPAWRTAKSILDHVRPFKNNTSLPQPPASLFAFQNFQEVLWRTTNMSGDSRSVFIVEHTQSGKSTEFQSAVPVRRNEKRIAIRPKRKRSAAARHLPRCRVRLTDLHAARRGKQPLNGSLKIFWRVSPAIYEYAVIFPAGSSHAARRASPPSLLVHIEASSIAREK